MELRRLGARGPNVAVVGYGAWEAGGIGWGVNPPDEQVLDAMRAGFDAGVNWVDTAEMYGNGRSEELIGQAIRDRPEVMVFSKVASAPRGSGYEPLNIRRAAEASLRRLRRNAIDLYQLHWPDETNVPLEETWGAMAELVDKGLARWIGVSNFSAEQIERCERIRHVDSVQPQLSMLWQERLPLLRSCKENGTGVIAYGPLAYGLLTGAITRATVFPDDDWRSGKRGLRAYEQLFAPGRFEANLDVADALRSAAARVGVSLAQLALAWVLHQDGITGVIAGSRSPQHVRENAGASNIMLSPNLVEIDAILERRGEVTVSSGGG
jgi:aryl-alcohol dehydrogenase-like predicted oxidoreductase